MFGELIGAMYAAPGAVIPVRSPHDIQYQQGLQGQMAWANAAIVVSEAERAARHKAYLRLCRKREQHRERKCMTVTKRGYRARERTEIAFWIAVGIVVLGGIVLPIGLRAYTSLWTWALGGG